MISAKTDLVPSVNPKIIIIIEEFGILACTCQYVPYIFIMKRD